MELAAYHTGKLMLEYQPEGARLVGDDPLQRALGRLARFLFEGLGQRTSNEGC